MFLQPFKASDWLLPTVLSTTASAVDVIGFLVLVDCSQPTLPATW